MRQRLVSRNANRGTDDSHGRTSAAARHARAVSHTAAMAAASRAATASRSASSVLVRQSKRVNGVGRCGLQNGHPHRRDRSTRVASCRALRAPRPPERSRDPPRTAASAVAASCGRWLTQAMSASWARRVVPHDSRDSDVPPHALDALAHRGASRALPRAGWLRETSRDAAAGKARALGARDRVRSERATEFHRRRARAPRGAAGSSCA